MHSLSALLVGCCFSTCLAFSFLGTKASSDPEPLVGVITDIYNGRRTTYDVTNQTTVDELRSVIPNIFDRTHMYDRPEEPDTFSIAFARLSGKAARTSLRHNALFPLKADLEHGQLYQFRFVQIPGEEVNPKAALSVGLSSLDTYGSGWKAKGVWVGNQGNLQAQGAVATGWADSWGVGQIVDWFVEIGYNATVDVFIVIDSRSYGHAFHLDFSDRIGQPLTVVPHLRPVVGFSEESDKGAVCMVAFKSTNIPKHGSYRVRQEHPTPVTNKELSGDWLMVDDTSVTVKVLHKGEDNEAGTITYRLTFKVINSISSTIVMDKDTGEVISKSVPMSTMMAGPADRMIKEQRIKKIIECLTTIAIKTDLNLNLSCPNDSVILKRYSPQIDPAEDNPFIANA